MLHELLETQCELDGGGKKGTLGKGGEQRPKNLGAQSLEFAARARRIPTGGPWENSGSLLESQVSYYNR